MASGMTSDKCSTLIKQLYVNCTNVGIYLELAAYRLGYKIVCNVCTSSNSYSMYRRPFPS